MANATKQRKMWQRAYPVVPAVIIGLQIQVGFQSAKSAFEVIKLLIAQNDIAQAERVIFGFDQILAVVMTFLIKAALEDLQPTVREFFDILAVESMGFQLTDRLAMRWDFSAVELIELEME